MSFVVFKGQGCMACGIYKGLGFTGLKGSGCLALLLPSRSAESRFKERCYRAFTPAAA